MPGTIRSLLRSVIGRSATLNAVAYGLVFATIYLARYFIEVEITLAQALGAVGIATVMGASVGLLGGSAAFLMLQRRRYTLTEARWVQVAIAAFGMAIFESLRVGPPSILALCTVIVVSITSGAISWVLSRWGLGTADTPQTQIINDRRTPDPMSF